ncbi:hypothetical protein M422DRAFT_50256 [Sphaerobolus stellatus SS14]|uniref:Uncharacterized protein n=1 Tax=Sphaerobolus stellatus (strain SS14) TaxID=990650 RepID=A0A0C9V8I7_SPHS4|nr:hypothetical protein M422DRAFT_50256 [Sphaerobolus stellatus SS14]
MQKFRRTLNSIIGKLQRNLPSSRNPATLQGTASASLAEPAVHVSTVVTYAGSAGKMVGKSRESNPSDSFLYAIFRPAVPFNEVNLHEISDLPEISPGVSKILNSLNESLTRLLQQDNCNVEALLWLLQTSTDPEVILSAINVIPYIQWLPQINYTFILTQMRSKLQPFIHDPKVNKHVDTREVWIWMKAFIQLGLPLSSQGDMPLYHPMDLAPYRWSKCLNKFSPAQDGS